MPASTPSTFNLFALPIALEADVTNSTAGQAGPRAGIPAPSVNGLGVKPRFVLGAQGEQDQDTAITVTTRRGGLLGTAGGTWTQSVSGGAAEVERGADPPAVLQGFYPYLWSVAGIYRMPMAVNLPNGTQLLVMAQRLNAAATWNIKVTTYDPDTDSYSALVTVASGLDKDFDPWPWLLLLPDGRVLCFYWNVNDTDNIANIDVASSEDYGATWATYAESALQSELVDVTTATTNRITATLAQEQIALMFHLTDTTDGEQIWQWFSADYGSTFTYLGQRTDAAYPVLLTVANAIYLYFLGFASPGQASVYVMPISAVSLFDPNNGIDLGINNVGTVTNSGGGVLILTDADLAAAVEDYYLWCWTMTYPNPEYYGVANRFDTTAGTADPTTTVIPWFWDGQTTSTQYPSGFSATLYRRQARIYANFVSSTSTYETNIGRYDLGGYSSVTMPIDDDPVQFNDYATWSHSYVPTALPSTGYGWTFTGAGTQSVITNPGALTLTTAANTAYESLAMSVAGTEGAMWLFRFQVDSGGVITDTTIGATIEISTALTKYKAALHASSTQLRIRDVHGGVDLGTIASTNTSFVDVLIAVNFGRCSAWARAAGSDWDRKWTVIVNGGTLTDGGAGGADLVEWGNITSGTATSEWRMVCGVYGSLLGIGSDIANGFSNPSDLHPFQYLYGPSYLAAGVSITARGGPAFPGDEYVIYPFAQFPICYAAPRGSAASRIELRGGQQPSPQVETRSIPTSEWGLTGLWRWQVPSTYDRYLPPILVCHVEGLNTTSAAVRTHATGGVSTSRGTLDMTSGATGLKFLRAGNLLLCDTSSASTTSPWFSPDILAGGYVVFAGNVIRPIVTNTAGNWGNSGTGQPPYIEIDGDDTEPSSGSCDIIWPRATFILYTDGTVEASGFELYWSTPPTTYEGYVKAGIVAFCEGIALYDMPSFNDAWDADPAAEVYASQFGVDRPRQTGTLRRIRELPIVSTYWDGRLRGSPASTVGERVYFTATSSASYPIIAASSDTAMKLYGLWFQAKGGAVPVVHVGRATRGTPNSYTLTGLEAGFYGTLATTAPRFSAVTGRDTGGVYATGQSGGTWTLREVR